MDSIKITEKPSSTERAIRFKYAEPNKCYLDYEVNCIDTIEKKLSSASLNVLNGSCDNLDSGKPYLIQSLTTSKDFNKTKDVYSDSN